MKIALPIFQNRISPRFDFSPEMWIIEVERGEVISRQELSTGNLNLLQRLEQITSNGVHKVICGGIDALALNRLVSEGIDVVQDVAGEAETAFHLFMRGRLRPGSCCERRKGRASCPWGRDLRKRKAST